jgi:hypothetical protein
MEQPTTNSVWARVFTASGYQMSVTLTFDGIHNLPSASEIERHLQAAGYLATAPGLEPGQEKEVIATVVKRVTTNDKTIIDFYPAWNANGSFGSYKYGHMYIDDDNDIAAFEAASGLKYADLPTMENADQAMTRKIDKRNKFEVDVKKVFEIVREDTGKSTDSGMKKYRYSYFVTPTAAPTPPNVTAQLAPTKDQHRIPARTEPTPSTHETQRQATQAADDTFEDWFPPTDAEQQQAGGKWFADSKQTWRVQNTLKVSPGAAAKALGKNMTDFSTADALIEAYQKAKAS